MNNIPEIERSIISRVMNSPKAYYMVAGRLHADDFYTPKYQLLYREIIKMYESSGGIDFWQLKENTKTKDYQDYCLTEQDIHHIYDEAVPENYFGVDKLAETVINDAMRRDLELSQSLIKQKLSGDDITNAEIIEEIEDRLRRIQDRKSQHKIAAIREPAANAFIELSQMADGQFDEGIPTGYKVLDTMTTGFHKAELIVLASRPGAGKTSLAVNFMDHIGVDKKIPLLFITLEMKMNQILHRLICSRAKVPYYKIRMGIVKDSELVKINSPVNEIADAPIYIVDSPTISIAEVKASCRQAMNLYKPQIIFIDYLQRIRTAKEESRQLEVSRISNELAALSIELNVPIVALAQLNREQGKSNNRRPKLTDLRESGSIEQDATTVMFIHRKTDKSNIYQPETELIVAKQRYGSPGVVHMTFLGDITRFELADNIHENDNYSSEEYD